MFCDVEKAVLPCTGERAVSQFLLYGDVFAPADAQPERVGAGIELSRFRVRNVQITEINAPMIFSPKNVNTNRARGREVEP